MPLYPIINKNTGEKKELRLSICEYEKWKSQNPEWTRDWSEGVASSISDVGEWKDKVPSAFKEKLRSIKNAHRGSTIDI